MRLYELESNTNTVYFVFINSNPPTFGYKRALDTLKETAGEFDHIAFINPAQDDDLFPLSFEDSLKYNKKIFPHANFHDSKSIQNPFQALKFLSEKYNKIYFLTRDKNVKDFQRMHRYAENWGVESFDIIGLGDSTRPLPTGSSKKEALQSVRDNDFDDFKKTLSTNNINVASELFIDLRKAMLGVDDESDKNDEVKEAVDQVYTVLESIAKYGNNWLMESNTTDLLGNDVMILENFVDAFKNLKVIFSKAVGKGVSFGKESNNNNYVLIMNCNKERLRQYIDLNESQIKEALECYINESVTSGGIASVPVSMGGTIKREIDYSFIDSLPDNPIMSKELSAINYVLSKYGYIDQDIIHNIEDRIHG